MPQETPTRVRVSIEQAAARRLYATVTRRNGDTDPAATPPASRPYKHHNGSYASVVTRQPGCRPPVHPGHSGCDAQARVRDANCRRRPRNGGGYGATHAHATAPTYGSPVGALTTPPPALLSSLAMAAVGCYKPRANVGTKLSTRRQQARQLDFVFLFARHLNGANDVWEATWCP